MEREHLRHNGASTDEARDGHQVVYERGEAAEAQIARMRPRVRVELSGRVAQLADRSEGRGRQRENLA